MQLVSRLGALLAMFAAVALVTAATGASRPGVFPCRSSWTLNQGVPAGLVVAGFGVDCAALRRNESLTVTGHLFKLNSHTGKWHLELTRTGRWANLAQRRSVDLREPCAAAMFRASFTAVLRYPNGTVAGRVAVDSGRLQVVVPCVFN
jgi:hypothetical protein